MLLLTFSLLACGSGTTEPPRIIPDQTVCAFCRMLVSETRFAAAHRVNGEDKVFDDLTCMLKALQNDPMPEQVWVRNFSREGWIDSSAAVFVRAESLRAPMGGHVVACDGAETARQLAEQHRGAVIGSFDQLRKEQLR